MNHLSFYHNSRISPILQRMLEEPLVPGEKETLVPVNIYEQQDCLEIELALPGLTKEEINIQVDENRSLRISGKPTEKQNSTQAVLRKKEFSTRGFTKNYRLGKGLNAEEISAVFENGVLRISISKIKAEQQQFARHIPLQ
jgi:HSP20 family protein